MMNLKNPGKKFYLKFVFNVIIYVLLTTAIAVILVCSNLERTKLTDLFEAEKKAITEKYETKLKELDKERTFLLTKENFYKNKIDSLYKVKNKVTIQYDEKIKDIYSADAYDNVHWLDSVIRQHTQVNSLRTQ